MYALAVGRADEEQHVLVKGRLAAQHLLEQLLTHRAVGLEREQVGTEQRHALGNRVDVALTALVRASVLLVPSAGECTVEAVGVERLVRVDVHMQVRAQLLRVERAHAARRNARRRELLGGRLAGCGGTIEIRAPSLRASHAPHHKQHAAL